MRSFDSSPSFQLHAGHDMQRRRLRWLPFVAAALFSLILSAQAPDGRHAFSIDWNLGADALAFSIAKPPHIGATAVLALLALLATGSAQWRRAVMLTVLVGAGWELCQSTIVGRTARIADLAPDAIGALLGCSVGMLALRLRDAAVPPRLRR
jgi:hypothetical protein